MRVSYLDESNNERILLKKDLNYGKESNQKKSYNIPKVTTTNLRFYFFNSDHFKQIKVSQIQLFGQTTPRDSETSSYTKVHYHKYWERGSLYQVIGRDHLYESKGSLSDYYLNHRLIGFKVIYSQSTTGSFRSIRSIAPIEDTNDC